jgi:hypothetical protein
VQEEAEGIGQQDYIGGTVSGLPHQSNKGCAIYILKYFKAKEELWKLKYFTTK